MSQHTGTSYIKRIRYRLLGVTAIALAMGLTTSAPVAQGPAQGRRPALRNPSAARLVSPLVDALNAALSQGSLQPFIDKATVTANWRFELAPTLAAIPQLHVDRHVTAPLRGRVMARTLVLPAEVQIAEDTVIVARHIVFSGRPARIITGGHDIHVYPIDSVDVAALGDDVEETDDEIPTRGPAVRALQDLIVIDATGADGANGAAGYVGQNGMPGSSGDGGVEGCPGTNGSIGGYGTHGTDGGNGGDGAEGETGGTITYDIPDGSTHNYSFLSNGGKGGKGGPGGVGGNGGYGGPGGNGGDCEINDGCTVGNGGDGGPGGPAGSGGWGGNGGKAANGGNGGTITISYPSGYSGTAGAAVAGGVPQEKGLGADGGLGGNGGMGGIGGQPSISGDPGNDGDSGPNGAPGYRGLDGEEGMQGSEGVIIEIWR